ncbi:MAG: M28 family peptidase [bacterium]
MSLSPISKILFVSIIFLNLFISATHAQRKAVRTANSVITTDLMQQNIGYLASDSLMGRNTPGPGLDSAAAYISRQFITAGLKPLKGSFYQDLDYCYVDLGPENILTLMTGDQKQDLKLKSDFVPYEITGDKSVEALVVFVGYGITAPEYGYDDYQGMDVKGKIVLLMRQEPGQTDSTRKEFDGTESTKYANLKEKIRMAKEHGATGMLVISGPLNYTNLKPRGFPWPVLSKTLPRDALPIVSCSDAGERIPVVHAGEALIKAVFGNADSLKRIQEGIEKSLKPNSFAIPGLVVMLKTSIVPMPLGGRNVIGIMEGSDPVLSREAVVVGAHYDHIGFIKEHKADTDYIFNGADDNASGTSGVLALAKAFSSMDEKPRRSVIFMAFAGEEKGLLGSATYVKNPLFPLGNTVAMIDLDMISRNYPDSLEIIGAHQNPDLVKIVRKANRKVRMVLEESKGDQMGGGSDHYSFYRKNIPDLFFFAGIHKDYHQVSDNPDRIDAEKAARVSRLAFLTLWKIANDDQKYKLIKGKEGSDE